jgi:hypothetical protein
MDSHWRVGNHDTRGKGFFSQIQFLGLHLKSNLDWEDEINAIVRKCKNPIIIVNCVKHTWWGVDPIILI